MAAYGDGLAAIRGLTAIDAARLKQVGITTLAELAALVPDEMIARVGRGFEVESVVVAKTAWVEAAAKLLGPPRQVAIGVRLLEFFAAGSETVGRVFQTAEQLSIRLTVVATERTASGPIEYTALVSAKAPGGSTVLLRERGAMVCGPEGITLVAPIPKTAPAVYRLGVHVLILDPEAAYRPLGSLHFDGGILYLW